MENVELKQSRKTEIRVFFGMSFVVCFILFAGVDMVNAQSWTVGSGGDSWSGNVTYDDTTKVQATGSVELKQLVDDYISHWRFDEGSGLTVYDENETNTNNGTLTDMDPAADRVGGKYGKALDFDGSNDYVNCGDDESLELISEITIEAWVKKQELSRIETILSKGSYSLKIGSDNKPYLELCVGSETITDVGQLGSNIYVHTLAVYNGKLYGGTYNSGHVYRYDGDTTWTDIGQLGSSTGIYSLAIYNSKLYGATGSSGCVYRYDGGTTWTDVGRLGLSGTVYSLAVCDGKLYGGTSYQGSVYCYDGINNWTEAGQLGDSCHVHALAVYSGKLYGGACAGTSAGHVYRYDGGTIWTDVGLLASASEINSLAVYDGKLYGAISFFEPSPGHVYRYDGGTTWTDVGQLGKYITSLAVYNGKLYSGTGSSGHLYRYDGSTIWTDVGQLGSSTGIYSLAVYDGKLYSGTGSSGRVCSIGDGLAVYSDTELDTEFRHITATYNGTISEIFLNGVLDNSRTKTLTIDTNSLAILIGSSYGSSQAENGNESFNGTIDEVRIYNRPLTPTEINQTMNNEHYTSGTLTSISKDAEDVGYSDNVWKRISITANIPTHTDVDIYVCSSQDNGIGDSWTDWTLVKDNAESSETYDLPLANQERYAKFRLVLNTSDASLTPEIKKVVFYVGVEAILPTVIEHSPRGTGVVRNSNVSVTFSEKMNEPSVKTAFSISPSVAGSFGWGGNKMIFTPSSDLAYETTYTVNISTEAEDLAGDNLESKYSWQFTTLDKPSKVEVMVYPSPYIKGRSLGERINFKNLPKGAILRIYTISRELIKEIKHKDTTDGGSEEWDISGVASGVYIYCIESSQRKKTGKVSIVK